MAGDQDEGSRDVLQRADKSPLQRGVVVDLSLHRRWRSRVHQNGGSTVIEEARSLAEEDAVPAAPPAADISPVPVTSCWAAGVAALLSIGLILGLYCILLAAIKALVNVPVIYP